MPEFGMFVIVSVSVPEALAHRLEKARGTASRSSFVRKALEEYLQRLPPEVPLIHQEGDP